MIGDIFKLMVESFSVVNQKVSEKETEKNLPVLKTQSHSPLSSVFFFFLWHIYKFSSLCLCTPLILYLTFKQWHIVSLDTYCGPVISMLMTDFIFGFWRNVQIYPLPNSKVFLPNHWFHWSDCLY